MKKILIQANNLDTVIDVFTYIYLHPSCKSQDIADFCGFTDRQVKYYTSACKYLDLIDDKWLPTALANDIFCNNREQIRECVYERIISDELMGKIFAHMLIFPNDDIDKFAYNYVKSRFPGYSDSVYERRSKNIVLWCKKILNYFEIKNS